MLGLLFTPFFSSISIIAKTKKQRTNQSMSSSQPKTKAKKSKSKAKNTPSPNLNQPISSRHQQQPTSFYHNLQDQPMYSPQNCHMAPNMYGYPSNYISYQMPIPNIQPQNQPQSQPQINRKIKPKTLTTSTYLIQIFLHNFKPK